MKKNNRTLNLEDIAQKAGVSRSTVSRVINNEPYVSEKTRQKVLTVVEREGFRPNPAARMLVTQRSRVIGIVIPNSINVLFDDPYYFPTLIRGITSVTSKQDYGSLLWLAQEHEVPEKFYLRILDNRLMDGLVLASAPSDSPMIEHLVQREMPFVLVERPTIFQDQVNYVTIDNVEAARIAVEHLLSIGRRRIATVSGNLAISDGQDRLKGYRMALENAGIPYDPKLAVEGRFNYQAGYIAMKQLLQYDVDAVFAASDRSAMGALKAIHEAGLQVPEDIAVVGFDDQLDALESGITSMRQPVYEKGQKATEILLDVIAGKIEGPRQVLLPTQLVIRDSSGRTHK